MELQEITILAKKLLETTYQLVTGPSTYKLPSSLFARVAEGTFRRDYLTLYTIVYLVEHKQPEARTAFATSCMDLCRRVQEDLISLEYMLLKGKEEYAKKFFDYAAVERKRDMDYLISVGSLIEPQLSKSINEQYDRVKDQFKDFSGKAKKKGWKELIDFLKLEGEISSQTEQKIEIEMEKRFSNVDGKIRKAWAGLDVEDMIQQLVYGGIIDTFQQKVLIQTYLKGNSKNHFSPTDIQAFLQNELYMHTNDSDLVLSVVVTTIAITRMAEIFADEVIVPDFIRQGIQEVGQALKTAYLPPVE